MNEPTQEQKIQKFLAGVADDTGTLRRYAKSLRRSKQWQVKDKK